MATWQETKELLNQSERVNARMNAIAELHVAALAAEDTVALGRLQELLDACHELMVAEAQGKR